jgi:hypothetical protein
MDNNLIKRTWHYIQPPKVFEISPCPCGNNETQWSEYEKHLWCDRCQKDFVPEFGGIFDGPILVGVCKLLGISFDRYNMETKEYEYFDTETLKYRAGQI